METTIDKEDDQFNQLTTQFVIPLTISWKLCITWTTSFLCFLPLLTNQPNNLRGTSLSDALFDNGNVGALLFQLGSVGLIVAVFPLFIDALFDIYDSFKHQFKSKSTQEAIHETKNVMDHAELLTFLFGLVITSILAFLNPSSYANFELIYLCTQRCQINLVSGAVALTLSQYDKKIFTIPMVLYVQIAGGIFCVMGSYSSNTSIPEPINPLYIIVDILGYSAASLLVVNMMRWLWIVFLQPFLYKNQIRRDSTTQLFSNTNNMNPSEQTFNVNSVFKNQMYFRGIFMVICIFCLVEYGAINGAYVNISVFDEKALLISLLPYLTFAIATNISNMRKVKYEVLHQLVNVITAKRTFVRYISHELRTPLNTAFVGISILDEVHANHARAIKHSRMTKSTDRPENASAVSESTVSSAYHDEVMGEIKYALKNVVDILDDLLLSEKMESGLMQLHKENVPILSMVKEVVNMFAPQSRRDHLTINVETHNNSVVGALPLLETDIVDADRFKLAQVLRNFLSNAIKFSPPDSAITVCTSFVPNVLRNGHLSNDDNDISTTSEERQPSSTATNTWRHLSVALTSSWLSGSGGRKGRRFGKPSIEDDVEMGEGNDDHATQNNSKKMMPGVLRVTVIDQGPGISKENQSLLFHEGVQFNPEILQSGGGSGFGLFISKNIIERHGGTMSCYSDPSACQGSSFTFELPMVRKVTTTALSRNSRTIWLGATTELAPRNNSKESAASSLSNKSISWRNPKIRNVKRLGPNQERGDEMESTENTIPAVHTTISNNSAIINTLIAATNNNHSNNSSNSNSGNNSISQMLPIDCDESMSPELTHPATVMQPSLPSSSSSSALSSTPPLLPLPPPTSSTPPPPPPDPPLPAESCRLSSSTSNASLQVLDGATYIDDNDAGDGDGCHSVSSMGNSTRTSTYGDVVLLPRFLVVDDHKQTRKVLSRVFDMKGVVIDEADNGAQAVEMAIRRHDRKIPYDAIIMDYTMPRMDGPTAVMALRVMGYEGKIIGCTGNAMKEEISEFQSAGVDDILVKPIDTEVLFVTLGLTE